jgi:NAD(P)-dependent dehydrogenase (short-subunit alcohol dehydrogenase family)
VSEPRRTYAVTGAASGIGAGVAAWLRERGHRVIACDLKDGDVAADLATADGRAALVEGVARLCGGTLDGVVANAGGGPPATMLSLNFFGAVATLEGLRPLLANSPAPRAVAVSSIASLQPGDRALVEPCLARDESAAIAATQAAMATDQGLNLYGSAKVALTRWCRKAAVGADWAGRDILLNVVAPGVIDTPAAAWILDNPQNRAEMMARVPLPSVRPGRPEQMAALIAWLAGPENTLMTGQVLYADGGVECAARGELVW